MKRIFAWLVLLLLAGFVIWGCVNLIKCSSDDKIPYKSYFTVRREEKTDEYIKFSFKNSERKRDNLNTYLLVYSLIFEVTTKDGNTFEYAVKLGESAVEGDPLKINVESVPTLAPKDKMEYAVYFSDVKDYMAQNALGGEIKTVSVNDVEFCKVEVNEQLFDEEYPEFRNYDFLSYPVDYFFNISYVDETVDESDGDLVIIKTYRTYTITLNNLVEGALHYDIRSIKFGFNYYGTSSHQDIDPAYQNGGESIVSADKSIVYRLSFSDGMTNLSIADIDFDIVWKG